MASKLSHLWGSVAKFVMGGKLLSFGNHTYVP